MMNLCKKIKEKFDIEKTYLYQYQKGEVIPNSAHFTIDVEPIRFVILVIKLNDNSNEYEMGEIRFIAGGLYELSPKINMNKIINAMNKLNSKFSYAKFFIDIFPDPDTSKTRCQITARQNFLVEENSVGEFTYDMFNSFIDEVFEGCYKLQKVMENN